MNIIDKLKKLIIEANGKRRAHIINPDMAEELIKQFKYVRDNIRKYKHNHFTLSMWYDPRCVPNCYRYNCKIGATKVVIMYQDRKLHVDAIEGQLQSRPHGIKWKYKFHFTPDGIHAVPPGFTPSGFLWE